MTQFSFGKSNSDRNIAYALLRVAFGINFFGHGLVRVIAGDQRFAAGVIKGFQSSPLPTLVVAPIAYGIPLWNLF